jgi:hypothetical protein
MAPAMKDESGWTLPEMLLGLVLSLGIAASSLVILQTALRSQHATGTRLAAQDDGTFAMLRMTKDIRTATAATVQDARTLDLQVPQRDPGGGAPVSVHVRYACTGGSCTRLVCGTPFVSNSCGSPTSTIVVATGVANSDNFRGVSRGVDQPFPSTTPTSWAGSGVAASDNVGFISVHVRVSRSDFLDGADLENYTN